ncbi:signal recognition particle-docking protein FtsY [Candidatus Woesearchaeota archaeon]|nr:signal recognition particle-docking protein FtsY [Candidatus Woesearchaeota archaeon]
MFKFLKDKLKSAISKISGKFEKEAEETKAEPIEKSAESGEDREKKEGKKELKEEISVLKEDIKEVFEEVREEAKKEEPELEEIKEEIKEIREEAEEVEKGFFGKLKEKITTKKISGEKFDELFNELELALLENNVAVEVIDKIKDDLRQSLVEKPIKRTKVEETIRESLKNSVNELFDVGEINLLNFIKSRKDRPFVIAFFGINGSGKTTTIAKIASMLKSKKISAVLAASDTFRAASIEQLQKHADSINVKMIRHDYKADPAAVAFDAIKYAKAKNIDVVLIDTAGRMHSNENLLNEMKKIIRVAKPDLKIFVGEAITGNDCVEQAKAFNESVGIDGIILAKADVDEKGGAFVSVSYVTKKPIMFLGTGQNYSDLQEFDSDAVIKNLGLD